MPYNSKITEARRALIILMIDQSGSMNEKFDSGESVLTESKSKAEVVADSCNLMLMDIIARCRKGACYKHYFDVAVIGYSGLGVRTLLPSGRWLMSPSQLAHSVLRTEKRERKSKKPDGEMVTYFETHKVWVLPEADGDTPMCAAMVKVSEILYSWRSAQKYNDNFPPTIINITDGELTDGVPDTLRKVSSKIRKQGTLDGEPIIFNVHISNDKLDKFIFPRTSEGLPREAELLFEISSPLPEVYSNAISSLTLDTSQSAVPYRAFSYNLPHTDFISVLKIGTTTTHQLQV